MITARFAIIKDDVDGSVDQARFNALVGGYSSVRPLSAEERLHWNLVLRGAALRFWLSRLLAARMAKSRSEELPAHKQPTEYRDRLRWHRAHSLPEG